MTRTCQYIGTGRTVFGQPLPDGGWRCTHTADWCVVQYARNITADVYVCHDHLAALCNPGTVNTVVSIVEAGSAKSEIQMLQGQLRELLVCASTFHDKPHHLFSQIRRMGLCWDPTNEQLLDNMNHAYDNAYRIPEKP